MKLKFKIENQQKCFIEGIDPQIKSVHNGYQDQARGINSTKSHTLGKKSLS